MNVFLERPTGGRRDNACTALLLQCPDVGTEVDVRRVDVVLPAMPLGDKYYESSLSDQTIVSMKFNHSKSYKISRNLLKFVMIINRCC